MSAPTRDRFPPEEFTDDELAAVAGRFVMDPEPKPAPAFKGREGRAPAAPHGVVYIRTETEAEPAEAEEEEEEEEVEEVEVGELTVPELKAELDALGIDYPANARKQELIDLWNEAG